MKWYTKLICHIKKIFYNCVNVNNILACNLKNELLYEKLKKIMKKLLMI